MTTVQIWRGEEGPTPQFLGDLREVAKMGTDGVDALGRKLNQWVEDEIIPQAVRERLGIQPAFAAETIPQLPSGWRENFIAGRSPRALTHKGERNFVISTGSVTAGSISRFVKDTFPLFEGGITVVYDKEADAREIRGELGPTEFWPRLRFRRVTAGLAASLSHAYQEYRGIGAVVVAPSIRDFAGPIPAHRRLVLNQALMEAGEEGLSRDILNQIAAPLADLPANLSAEEIDRQMARLISLWSQRGFRGIRFDEGIIPNFRLYLEYVSAQSEADSLAKTSA
jgi:hypothetical protein